MDAGALLYWVARNGTWVINPDVALRETVPRIDEVVPGDVVSSRGSFQIGMVVGIEEGILSVVSFDSDMNIPVRTSIDRQLLAGGGILLRGVARPPWR
jgi:hypothetical protein